MSEHVPQPTPFLKRGAVIHVSFQLALPSDATREEIMEWVGYQLGHMGSIGDDNPLCDEEINPMAEPVLTEMGLFSWNELVTIEREGDSTIFTTRQVFGRDPPPPGSSLSSSETTFRETIAKRVT